MKSKRFAAVLHRSFLPVFAAVLALAISGRVWAGIEAPGPNDDAANAPGVSADIAWDVPYDAVSAGMMTQFQQYLRTDGGADLIKQYPSLGAIRNLNPKIEAHRRIIGILGLPTNFASLLSSAVKAPNDRQTGSQVHAEVLKAYKSQDVEGQIAQVVNARADAALVAMSQGRLSARQYEAIFLGLFPFSSISVKARKAGAMARGGFSLMGGEADAQRDAINILRNKDVWDGAQKYLNKNPGAWVDFSKGIEQFGAADESLVAATKEVPFVAAPAVPAPNVTQKRPFRPSLEWRPMTDILAAYINKYSLPKQYDGKKFSNTGILRVVLVNEGLGVEIDQKMKPFDTYVFITRKDFRNAQSAKRYAESLPDGKPVVLDFTVKYGNGFFDRFSKPAPSPFRIDKIAPAKAPASLIKRFQKIGISLLAGSGIIAMLAGLGAGGWIGTVSAIAACAFLLAGVAALMPRLTTLINAAKAIGGLISPAKSTSSMDAKTVKILSRLAAPLMLASGAAFWIFGVPAFGAPFVLFGGALLAGGVAYALSPLLISENQIAAKIFGHIIGILLAAGVSAIMAGVLLVFVFRLLV